MRFRWFLIVPLLLPLILTAGCSGDAHEGSTEAGMAGMPDYVQNAPSVVRQAYQFAVDHPDRLQFQPCYCGCGTMGHINNLSCFVQEFRADGTIVYDNHAAGCGICVDIAQDVMRLSGQGMSQRDIRTYIDAQYSPFGPSTDTPLPPA